MKLKRIDATLLVAFIVILGIIGAVLVLTEIAWSRPYVDSPVNIGSPPNWMILMGFVGIGLMGFPPIIALMYLDKQNETRA